MGFDGGFPASSRYKRHVRPSVFSSPETMFRMHDTIVAMSSPAGSGPRAILRASGPDAQAIAERVFTPIPPRPLGMLGGFRAVQGLCRADERAPQYPARALVFRAPRSYTRQDLIELHIPGNPLLAAALLEAMVQAGARRAEAGEFTARAFFSGRIDLSQAEAVCDLISSSSDTQRRSALAMLGGTVRQACAAASEDLANTLATVEASIDLAEEAIELACPQTLAAALTRRAEGLGDLATRAGDIPDAVEQPRVVLAGAPNAGKSTLLNALSGQDRAITSALAGTTRDVLSAPLPLPGSATVLLVDAAGLGYDRDPLARAAHEAARQAVQRADLLLLVVDSHNTNAHPDLREEILAMNPNVPRMTVNTKADLIDASAREALRGAPVPPDHEPVAVVSGQTGAGIDPLRHRISEMLDLSAERDAGSLGLHRRQKASLRTAEQACRNAAALLEGASDIAAVADIAAVEIREAIAHLGSIDGRALSEDILGRIFARFCVGK